jgi:succinate dehydrogenase / fumarate reductase flavoprotein subunit
MAIGEAACVSVHGANRLGSNSLIDLVVFGRAAGLRCAEKIEPQRQSAGTAEGRDRAGAVALDRFRHAKGGDADIADLRLKMQKVMQTNCAVFRTMVRRAEGGRRSSFTASGKRRAT